MANQYPSLNPEKALIWRIVHRDNVPWILRNGIHCRNSPLQDPHYVNIGSTELIDKRARHPVPIAPGGVLNDYVPFYFTPFSVMMRNILSGRGVPQRSNDEIVILVSSLHRVQACGLPFLFTDCHAYYEWADFYSDLKDLDKINWPLLQRRDFKRDPEDPLKFEQYQAEALVHRHVPLEALLGIVCYTSQQQATLEQQVKALNLNLKVHAKPQWYFR